MSFRVIFTPAARRQELEQADAMDRSPAGPNLTDRWLDAVATVLESLAETPHARPLCLDPAAEGTGLREAYVKIGRRKPHRLIFRIDADTVTVLLVWPTALGDFAAGDLPAGADSR